MSKIKKVEGNCPYCSAKNKIILCDYYYTNCKEPFATDVARCEICGNDEIEIRKINNRRYKVVGKW